MPDGSGPEIDIWAVKKIGYNEQTPLFSAADLGGIYKLELQAFFTVDSAGKLSLVIKPWCLVLT